MGARSARKPLTPWRFCCAPSQLGMAKEELREQLRNAGSGKTELDTFFTDGCPRCTPPAEQDG